MITKPKSNIVVVDQGRVKHSREAAREVQRAAARETQRARETQLAVEREIQEQ